MDRLHAGGRIRRAEEQKPRCPEQVSLKGNEEKLAVEHTLRGSSWFPRVSITW